MTDTRTESDSFGPIEVPADRYWGAQTARSALAPVLAGAPAACALCRPPGHHAGRDYAAGRNSDLGPEGASAVSRLSPYVRYQAILGTLDRFSETATAGNALIFGRETFGSQSLNLGLRGSITRDAQLGAFDAKVKPFFRAELQHALVPAI